MSFSLKGVSRKAFGGSGNRLGDTEATELGEASWGGTQSSKTETRRETPTWQSLDLGWGRLGCLGRCRGNEKLVRVRHRECLTLNGVGLLALRGALLTAAQARRQPEARGLPCAERCCGRWFGAETMHAAQVVSMNAAAIRHTGADP